MNKLMNISDKYYQNSCANELYLLDVFAFYFRRIITYAVVGTSFDELLISEDSLAI